MRSRSVRLFSVACLAAIPLLGACGGGSSSGSGFAGSLEWEECEDENLLASGVECATFAVPLDWSDTDGETIDLALVRIPAGGESRGILLANPGGPGASGIDFVVNTGTAMVSDLGLGEYDIVGFDPRGTGRSTPLRCVDDADLDVWLYVDSTPDDAAEQALYDEYDEFFEEKCAEVYGDDLRHYSTEATARDMDAIRAASGFDEIAYYGVSYGTYLGGVYATLFPDRVGVMLLDAAFDPAGDTPEQARTTQTIGFEKALNNWADWCESSDTCAYRSRDVLADWDDLVERLDSDPFEKDGRTVNDTVLGTATVSALYSETQWAQLGVALATAEEGDGTGLLALADSYHERSDDGTYAASSQAFPIIRCASGFYNEDPADPEALLETLLREAPRMSKGTTVDDLTGTGCEGLTEDADIIELSYDGDAPIVVVGGENDPATPIRWAEEMAASLGAPLVRFTGEGHGFALDSLCVADIALSLFADGTLPDDETVCEPDPDLTEPEWWADVPGPASGEKRIDGSTFDGLFGFRPSRFWREYRVSSVGVEEAYARFVERMATADFVPDDPSAVEASSAPQFFEDANGNFVGLFTVSQEELESYGFTDVVPQGHTLMALYWYPLGD
jgi:pimeloyl-ACP methyl ester carboxylesterase